MSEERPLGPLLAGIILIGLGVLFLLDRFYAIRFAEFFHLWWPSLLILWGAVILVSSRRRHKTGALILITLGFIFQGEMLHWAYWWEMDRLWPVLLIAIGIGVMLRRMSGRTQNGAPPSAPQQGVGDKA
jgi:hypothetical protein